MVALWRARWLFPLTIALMAGLALAAAFSAPALFVGQFNPATLNLAMIALALIGWWTSRDLPSARRCLRRERRGRPG
jgi:hypothetical protein